MSAESIELCGWGYATGETGSKIALHRHDFYQAEFIISGACAYNVDGREITLREGEILLLAPHVLHSVRYVADCLGYTFKFHANFHYVNNVLHVEASTFTRGVLDAIRATLNATFPPSYFGMPGGAIILNDDRYQVMMEHLLTGVFSQLFAEKQKFLGPLVQVREILSASRGHYLSVADAAKLYGCSRNHFLRLIKQYSGLSAKKFLNQLRIEDAMRYLRFSDLSILEISEQLGFSSQFHFSDFFKRETGFSPLACRKQYSCQAKQRS